MRIDDQDRFSAELVHQLKTPLAVLNTSAINLRRNLRALMADIGSIGGSAGGNAPSLAGFVSQALEQPVEAPRTGQPPVDRVDEVVERLREMGVDGDLNAAASQLIRGGWDPHLQVLSPGLQAQPALTLQLLEAAARLRSNLFGIESSARRIHRLTVALRALSGPVMVERVDLRNDLEETLSHLRTVLPEGISIDLALPEIPDISASTGLLGEVWSNLIMNAAQSMGESGILRIEASTSHRAGEVTVRFIDDGPGISPDLQDRIFEPFFTTRTEQGGSGLGLAVVNRIVERLGGRIEVSSVTGRTCFEVVLPVAGAVQEEAGRG